MLVGGPVQLPGVSMRKDGTGLKSLPPPQLSISSGMDIVLVSNVHPLKVNHGSFFSLAS